MKVALVNPPWTFGGSIYFGCREPHLPLEYGYSAALLRARGHEAEIFDAHLCGLSYAALRAEVGAFAPDVIVVTTAPSYLFWRCAPPELRAPQETLFELREVPGLRVVVGPHASTTPRTALRKLGADVAVLGECEEVLVELVDTPRSSWAELDSIAYVEDGRTRVQGSPRGCDLAKLPELAWNRDVLLRHGHHHHRFDRPPDGPGAEVEATRGCPFHCTFCAKDQFRDGFRKRPLAKVCAEIDALLERGVTYLYFIDEIFVPDRALLDALTSRTVSFGVQLRIDHWTDEMLDRLGAAGCVSIEAGVESVTPEGRRLLEKKCRPSTHEIAERLIHAKRRVPFVQANLLASQSDRPDEVQEFRDYLKAHGVWANEPVPLFPYPGSPEYTLRFGPLDDRAWERAHEDYLARFESFSDLQSARPRPLGELELPNLSAYHRGLVAS